MLVDGVLSLIKTTAVVPRQASTSPTVVPDNATGSETLIIEKYFFVKDEDLFEVSMRKNQNLDFIDNAEVSKYVRDNRVSFSSEGGLKTIANYYNKVCEDM